MENDMILCSYVLLYSILLCKVKGTSAAGIRYYFYSRWFCLVPGNEGDIAVRVIGTRARTQHTASENNGGGVGLGW